MTARLPQTSTVAHDLAGPTIADNDHHGNASLSTQLPPSGECTRKRSLHAMRRAYFADAGTVITRYGVRFEDIITHLWQTRAHRRDRMQLQTIRHLEDLAHVVACCRGDHRAWRDLDTLYGRWLTVRSRRHVGGQRAGMIVGNFLGQLRCTNDPDGFASYRGEQPLRLWMCNTLGLRLASQGIDARDLVFGAHLNAMRRTFDGPAENLA